MYIYAHAYNEFLFVLALNISLTLVLNLLSAMNKAMIAARVASSM